MGAVDLLADEGVNLLAREEPQAVDLLEDITEAAPSAYVPSGERKSVLETLSEGVESLFKRPAPTVNVEAANEASRLMVERQQRSGTAEELAAFAQDDVRRAEAAKAKGSE